MEVEDGQVLALTQKGCPDAGASGLGLAAIPPRSGMAARAKVHAFGLESSCVHIPPGGRAALKSGLGARGRTYLSGLAIL
jgi:hypothetical protein